LLADKRATPDSDYSALLRGVDAFIEPNYHKLNKRGHRLIHACLAAYAKIACEIDAVSTDDVIDILHSAICNEIGDDAYCEWVGKID
jgi:hypothetical protein